MSKKKNEKYTEIGREREKEKGFRHLLSLALHTLSQRGGQGILEHDFGRIMNNFPKFRASRSQTKLWYRALHKQSSAVRPRRQNPPPDHFMRSGGSSGMDRALSAIWETRGNQPVRTAGKPARFQDTHISARDEP